MKFGKQFSSQLVQEWKEAYMDYNTLKKDLKSLLRRTTTQSPPKGSVLKRKVTMYRAFSGLTNHRHSPEEEDEVIEVCEEDGLCKTKFLLCGELEAEFFAKLDDEFNKVVKFYRLKVEEVVAEADELSKQMEAFIALRIKVDDPAIEDSVYGGRKSDEDRSHMSTIQESEISSEGYSEEGSRRGDEIGSAIDSGAFKPASLEVLDHVKININTPVSTLKGVLLSSKAEKSFTKGELKRTERLLAKAFVEFYRKLHHLKSYCFLNQLAFSKILKKYDKTTSRNASKTYLEMVDNSYLGSCDEVAKLMARVEATFIKHFANGNHRKGMNSLRPKAKKETHSITFFLGCFFGFSLALLAAIVVAIHARDVLHSPGRSRYMENIFPLYSLFGYIVLHMVMYAGNVYFWKLYRVNYSFIFGFKPGTELGYREVLFLSSILSVLMLGGVLSNLDMEMDPRTKSFEAITELVPLGLLLVVALITFCPFNILYRSSRYFLIGCIIRCICAPLYKVTLPDFFLADQFTSQVQALRSLEFYICYYSWGDFKRRSNKCSGSDVYQVFYLVAAIFPYWIRFVQSVRRLIEEKDKMHGFNGLKYLSAIVAVTTRTIHELRPGSAWLSIAAVSSAVATIANTYWDIVVDWGLMQRNSRNAWLRDKLILPRKRIYFIAMVVNIILRFAWMQTILGFREAPFLHRKALVAIVASLEIIRRGIWNFFRLENEHLNNVGKYRAFKSVPLPFDYSVGDDKSL